MRSRHVLAKTLSRRPVPLKANPNLISSSIRPGWLEESVFDSAPLPKDLFKDPAVSILRATPGDRQFNAQFLLFRRPRLKSPPPPPTDYSGQAFKNRMLNWVQIVATPTADTHGTCLLLHFDNKRYFFGNISEGTQRTAIQRGFGVNKIEDLFLTGVVNWHNVGGVLGTILVLADTLATRIEALRARLEERKKKGQAIYEVDVTKGLSMPRLNIHGGKNLAYLLATARRFVFRKGLPLNPLEIRDDPRLNAERAAKPDWQDININVWYMPVQPTTTPSASPRKRTHEEFTEASDAHKRQPAPSPTSSSADDEDKKLVDTVVAQMFDSDWTMDALVETTLYKAVLPAKLFVRDNKGHIQEYTGPLPGKGQEVPDIPVLVRQPWPGAMVASLPRTKPSNQSICYIVKTHDRRGKFNRQAAESYGVAIPDYKHLASGQSVTGKDGVLVTPDMVLESTVPGNGFAVVDLPDASYIDALVNRTEWSNDTIMNGIHVIFWFLGSGVANEPRLQEFMRKMSAMKHIVTSADSCPNRIAFESAAAQTFKLRCIDPDRFSLPTYNNEVSILNTPTTDIKHIYEVGQLGKTVQFAPQYLHKDDKIVPFPDIEKLAREGLTDEILEMAKKARAKASDPDFLAKVEKVESDIPHRDAEVITLGTGSALPSKYRNVSATLIRVPGCGNYLFDCGENTLGQLHRVLGNETPEVLRDLKGIWISHLHADHHLGTASIIKAWHEETSRSNPSATLLIASHGHMIDWLREYSDVENYGFDRLKTMTFNGPDPSIPGGKTCNPRIFTEEDRSTFGIERIDACFVRHCFGALATVFTFPSGLKIAYSGDCRPSEDFVKIGKGATLLIHESTFEDELRGDANAKKHSTMSEAIGVGRRMEARRILLTHFSQRYQKVPIIEDNLEVPVDAEGRKAGPDEVILVAFDYMRIKIGDFRKAQVFLPTIQKLFEGEEDNQ